MMDDYWDEDTVFFVFEDDFRFEDVPTLPMSLWDAEAADAAPGGNFAPQQVKFSPHQKRVQGQWFEVPTKEMDPDLDEPAASRIQDLMHYMIQAHRNHCGHIVWMSWQPSHAGSAPQRPHSPKFGSLLWGITPAGARSIHAAIASGDLPSGHVDVKLREWLIKKGKEVQGCCLVPPLGNFRTSASAVDVSMSAERNAVRQSCWEDDWCTPGTRMADDLQGRRKKLTWITAKGAASVITPLDDPSEEMDLKWWTYDALSDEPAASEAKLDITPGTFQSELNVPSDYKKSTKISPAYRKRNISSSPSPSTSPDRWRAKRGHASSSSAPGPSAVEPAATAGGAPTEKKNRSEKKGSGARSASTPLSATGATQLRRRAAS